MSLHDNIVIVPAIAALLVFLIIHFSLFRFISSQDVMRSLIRTFLMGGAAHGILFFFYCGQDGRLAAWMLSGKAFLFAISCFFYCCMAFFYTVWISGPYEASLRWL